MMILSKKTTFVAAIAMFIAFAVSFAVYRIPVLETTIFVVLCALLAFAYVRSFALGTAILFGEIVGGSLGHLFQIGGFSIRMAFFAIALLFTIWRFIRSKEDREFVWQMVKKHSVVFLGVMIAYGVILGFFQTSFKDVVNDANAYAFFLLLPTFVLALKDKEEQGKFISVAFGVTAATAILSFILFILFTHATPEPVLRVLYKWVRDFGLGEITKAPGGFYRVFFQSHVWNFLVFLLAPFFIIARPKDRWVWGIGILSAIVVFLSFSRTFWLAGLCALAVAFVVMIAKKTMRPALKIFVASLVALTALGVFIPFLATHTVSSALLTRTSALGGEAALDSRMNLLPVMLHAIEKQPLFGYGFGKTLTYVTKDPRLLAYFPDGNYITSAFEWGWLDFWLKMGILGVLAYVLFLKDVFKGLIAKIREAEDKEVFVYLGLATALVGLIVAHVFSPWLNHPLGIGFLLVVGGVVWGEELEKCKWIK